jgi:hypothetical protein
MASFSHSIPISFFSYVRLTSQWRTVDKSSLYEAKEKGVNKHFSDAHKFPLWVNSQCRKWHVTVKETNIYPAIMWRKTGKKEQINDHALYWWCWYLTKMRHVLRFTVQWHGEEYRTRKGWRWRCRERLIPSNTCEEAKEKQQNSAQKIVRLEISLVSQLFKKYPAFM